MIKSQFILILFFVLSAMQIVNAQENNLVILNLKSGYSVKGEIIEQTAQGIKIKTLDGEIFEYRVDEIESTKETLSSPTSKLFSSSKKIPPVLVKGDMVANLGIGFIRTYSDNSYEKLAIPPIPISFEYILLDNLFDGNGAVGIGGFLGYSSSKADLYEEYKYSRLIVGARAYLHYAIVEKLDTYAGTLIGYQSTNTTISYSDYPDNKIIDGKPAINIFAGCRYFFTDNIAGMAELGWGISILTVGASIKF